MGRIGKTMPPLIPPMNVSSANTQAARLTEHGGSKGPAP